nr:immunoglobulin light chain junction region [Macaca mulatta]
DYYCQLWGSLGDHPLF